MLQTLRARSLVTLVLIVGGAVLLLGGAQLAATLVSLDVLTVQQLTHQCLQLEREFTRESQRLAREAARELVRHGFPQMAALHAPWDRVLAGEPLVALQVLDREGNVLTARGVVPPDASEFANLADDARSLRVEQPLQVPGGTTEGRLVLWLEPGRFGEALTGITAELTLLQAGERRRIVARTAGVAVAVLLLCTLLAWFAAQRLEKPLRALNDRATQFGSDTTNQLAGSRQNDQVSKLEQAFEAMRQRLTAATVTRDYLDQVLSSMNEALVIVDRNGTMVRVNQATCRLVERTEEQLVDRPLAELMGEHHARELLSGSDDERPREAIMLRADGESIPVSLTCSSVDIPKSGFSGRVIAAQDITERKRAEQRIRYLARIDALTKVPNRMQFQHLLQRAIARARRRGQYLGLLYVDVDRFKDINDTFGHLAGDVSLENFAHRLLATVPDSAIVGRLAGDEFAVIVDHFESLDTMMQVLEDTVKALLNSLTQPMRVQGHEIFLTASIGVARYPIDGADVIDLIRNADAALYQAKKSGGNTYEFYSPDMNAQAVERLMLKSKLRRALQNDELTLRYQPKYSLATGKVMGAEALVRWDMPERGLILPSDFVPLAEETNLILDLGNWVLRQVCSDYRRWQRTLASPGRVSVNLSLKQLRQPHFIQTVGDVFRSHGVSPTSLELEITETTLMENAERTVKLLDALYAMGLHLAIDDFGTGYSSLSALQHFPISTLKIDRSFVRHAASDREDATIVSTIIQMAHNLGMDVVAEGVETEEQLEFLRARRCDYVQGMLFGEPFEAGEYVALLLRQMEGTDRHRALFA